MQARVRAREEDDFHDNNHSSSFLRDVYASIYYASSPPPLQVLPTIDNFPQVRCGAISIFVHKLGNKSIHLRMEGPKVSPGFHRMLEDVPKESETLADRGRIAFTWTTETKTNCQTESGEFFTEH